MLPNLREKLGGLQRRGPIPDARLAALYRLWDEKRCERRYPSSADFEAAALRPWAGHLGSVQVHHAPVRFRILSMDEELIALAGGDYTGRWLDECTGPERYASVLRPYLRCLEAGRPVYDNISYTVAGSDADAAGPTTLLRLFLPCAGDGETVDLVMVGAYRKEEVVPFRRP